MAKSNSKISLENLLIDEIENSSNNSWNELCDACSSLIKEVNMSDEEIDKIVELSKEK